MNPYPYCLFRCRIAPILGPKFRERPMYLPVAERKTAYGSSDAQVDKTAQTIDQTVARSRSKWAVGGYLENCEVLFAKDAQILKERRFFHLGVDIIAKKGTWIYAPLDGEVIVSDREEVDGGGYTIIKSSCGVTSLYLLFSHLSPKKMLPVGTKVKAGRKIGMITDGALIRESCSHLHFQVLTERAYANGWATKNYAIPMEALTASEFCPDPTFLIKLAK